MTTRVEQITQQVKALPPDEREELLSWLFDFASQQPDDWDKQLAQDSQAGGRLSGMLDQVRRDIAEGRTKPLDEVVDDA